MKFKSDALKKCINKNENEDDNLALEAQRLNILSPIAEWNRKRKRVTEMRSEAMLMSSKILNLENAVATG